MVVFSDDTMTVTFVVSQVAPALADDEQEATRLVEKARLTLDSFILDLFSRRAGS